MVFRECLTGGKMSTSVVHQYDALVASLFTI